MKSIFLILGMATPPTTFNDLKGEDCVQWRTILCGYGKLPEDTRQWTREDDKFALCLARVFVQCYKE